mmetsp:Transcript_13540/g.28185  ORF Transcript_13540/g.28185 Transcript_13540/m.28185 type:complete len:201 (+) Transcript_13540:209-811(+)
MALAAEGQCGRLHHLLDEVGILHALQGLELGPEAAAAAEKVAQPRECPRILWRVASLLLDLNLFDALHDLPLILGELLVQLRQGFHGAPVFDAVIDRGHASLVTLQHGLGWGHGLGLDLRTEVHLAALVGGARRQRTSQAGGRPCGREEPVAESAEASDDSDTQAQDAEDASHCGGDRIRRCCNGASGEAQTAWTILSQG